MELNADSFHAFIFLPGVGIGVPAAAQAIQQVPTVQTAPQALQTANLQLQGTPQHQQLFMKQQQAPAFLSPQINQQVPFHQQKT